MQAISTGEVIMGFQIKSADGKQISSVEDWLRYAPPQKGECQWKDGRSAKELAKAFFREGRAELPGELQRLFEDSDLTKGLVCHAAVPEKTTQLDIPTRKPRYHDLVLTGTIEGKKAIVCIEAKADETFGEIVRDHYAKNAAVHSDVPKRIEQMSQGLFGLKYNNNDGPVADLRYQLLTSLAGTVIEARIQDAAIAIFLVYEFVTDKTSPQKIQANSDDLQRFARMYGCQKLETGKLFGPLKIHGDQYIPATIPAYMAKVSI